MIFYFIYHFFFLRFDGFDLTLVGEPLVSPEPCDEDEGEVIFLEALTACL